MGGWEGVRQRKKGGGMEESGGGLKPSSDVPQNETRNPETYQKAVSCFLCIHFIIIIKCLMEKSRESRDLSW